MATLKISDLSVGDWVRTKDGNVTVDIISPLEVVVMNDYGNLCACKIEDIEPTPITAEILEKNEFTRRSGEFPIYEYTTLLGKMLRKTVVSLNHPYSYIVCKIEDTSKELHDTNRITASSSVDRNPIYIHDLQHALRLAGLDKEINL